MDYFKFDTHMHFDLFKDRQKVIDYCNNNRIYTIAVTNLPNLYEKYYNQNIQSKYLKIALGFHPELVSEYKTQIKKFDQYATTTKYIGEVGLDYSSNDKENRNDQKIIFDRIVQTCNTFGDKVLTVHSRKAENDVLSILENNPNKIIMHWFSGSLKQQELALSNGYYFSINHQMLQSKNGRRIIDSIPIERILIESDAPFTNGLDMYYNVDFMNNIYDYLSITRHIEISELSIILKDNFKRLLL